MRLPNFSISAACLIALCCTRTLPAAIVAYTDQAMFNTALLGLSQSIVNFDSTPVGTLLPSGSGIGGVNFQYSFAAQLLVTDGTRNGAPPLSAHSGTRFLGLDIVGAQLAPTFNNFTMTFNSPVSALGLFVVVSDDQGASPAFPDDLLLTSSQGGQTASLNTNLSYPTITTSPANPSRAFFLGLVENTGASLGTVGLSANQFATGYGYRVDDITFVAAVPEPSTCLAGAVLLAVCTLRRKRARAA